MSRKVIIFGAIFFVLLVALFGISFLIFSTGTSNLKSVVYNGQVVPYGYSHFPEVAKDPVLTGVISSVDVSSSNPTLTIATSKFSIQGLTIPLDLAGKQTLFTDHTSERQTDFFWTSYTTAELAEKLSKDIPVSLFFKDSSKIPYLVMVHSYLK